MITLISANRVIGLGVGSFILPALVTLAGGFLLARPSFVGEAIGVFAGAALIIFGASELLSSWKMKKAMDEYDIKHPQDVVDTDNVDEQ